MLKESALYGDVINWLEGLLKSRNKKSLVRVYNTSRITLRSFLQSEGYDKFFKDFISYEIRVDITGFVIKKREAYMSFVECKINPISLKDISQLLGYSRVALPQNSIILSPNGISSAMSYLLKTLNRLDVLEYDKNKKIKVVKWDLSKKDVDHSSILPSGETV